MLRRTFRAFKDGAFNLFIEDLQYFLTLEKSLHPKERAVVPIISHGSGGRRAENTMKGLHFSQLRRRSFSPFQFINHLAQEGKILSETNPFPFVGRRIHDGDTWGLQALLSNQMPNLVKQLGLLTTRPRKHTTIHTPSTNKQTFQRQTLLFSRPSSTSLT
uniref:Uncharacterized protein n=1 Tax=Lepeophtheirus salmonis TaxID=72036 RepID=A0A0K2V885_LEPSM